MSSLGEVLKLLRDAPSEPLTYATRKAWGGKRFICLAIGMNSEGTWIEVVYQTKGDGEPLMQWVSTHKDSNCCDWSIVTPIPP